MTIALLFVSAAPPPRVTNALIADAHRHDRSEAGKTVHSRARNRIGEPIKVAPCRTIAGLSGGPARPGRSPRLLARRPDQPSAVRPPSPPSATSLVPFRLRC